MGAPSTVALTDDGGRPIIHDPRANEGPVPGAPVWDRWLSESSARLASIIAHRKGPSSAHDSSISNAAASASPSPGQLNPPIKDSKSSGAAALDPGSWPRTPTDGVRVEKVRHDDDGIAQAGGITPTALFPVTAALTDDGGWPPDPSANEGPVPGAMTWDRRLSESSSRLASIVAHRKGNSSAHDSIMCRGGPTGSAACCRRQCSRSASGRGLTPTAPATQPTGAASFLGTCRWCCRHFVALAQAKAGPLLRGRRVLRVR